MAEAQPIESSDIIQASNSSVIPDEVIRSTIAQVEGSTAPVNQDVDQQQQVTSCQILKTLNDFLARFSRFEKEAKNDRLKVQQLYEHFNSETSNVSKRKTPKKIVAKVFKVLLFLMMCLLQLPLLMQGRDRRFYRSSHT